jgi:hypothetical protein
LDHDTYNFRCDNTTTPSAVQEMKNWNLPLVFYLALGVVKVQSFGLENKPGACIDTLTSPSGLSRRSLVQDMLLSSFVLPATLSAFPQSASARLESVNRPDLLPSEKGLNVIQTEKFLTAGQARRMNEMLAALEKDTGFRVKVLCQNYPNTPGLAIRDYWSLGKEDQMDDKYVVLVVDQFGGRGNSLNFNVGDVSDAGKQIMNCLSWLSLSGQS